MLRRATRHICDRGLHYAMKQAIGRHRRLDSSHPSALKRLHPHGKPGPIRIEDHDDAEPHLEDLPEFAGPDMTDPRPPVASAPVPLVPVPAEPALDEVMLAMDVVDTLRHEQEVIVRELNSDARDAAFVARVKQIYANQGIDVSDEIVRQGVEALKQDRFTHVPPKRTIAVRLAEIYIDRWKWFKRTTFASLGLGTLWLIATLPGQIADSVAHGRYEDQVAAVLSESTGRQSEIDSQQRRLDELDPTELPITEAPVGDLKAGAAKQLAKARDITTALSVLTPIEADPFARDPEAAARVLASEQARLAELPPLLDSVRADLGKAADLQHHERQLIKSRTILRGVTLAESAAAVITNLDSSAQAALRAGDVTLAGTTIASLSQKALQADLAYELRIVNRQGVQSGIRRRAEGQAEGRSHYLVVEAIDVNGNTLELPITNEETQKIESVSRFAIRVPESVYDRVRADEQDNGLIDDVIVGRKERGAFDPEYTVDTAGGTITRW